MAGTQRKRERELQLTHTFANAREEGKFSTERREARL
jgi:hypothetical protein